MRVRFLIVVVAMIVFCDAAPAFIAKPADTRNSSLADRYDKAEVGEVVKYLYDGDFYEVVSCGNGDGYVVFEPSTNKCCILMKVEGTGSWIVTSPDGSEVYGGGEYPTVTRYEVLDPVTGLETWQYYFSFLQGGWWN